MEADRGGEENVRQVSRCHFPEISSGYSMSVFLSLAVFDRQQKDALDRARADNSGIVAGSGSATYS